MKSLFFTISLVFSSLAYAQSNDLAVSALTKKNAKIDISNLELAQTYSHGRTCAETDSDGYCVKYAEHVYTLLNHIYTNLAKYSHNYKTEDNFDVKWRCWGSFNASKNDQYEKSVDQVANYPKNFKKEYRVPYQNQKAGFLLAPPGVLFNVKDQYKVLNAKLVEYSLTEKELCSPNDVGDDSAPLCHGKHKLRTLKFKAPVSENASFDFNCKANVPAESKDTLDITREDLNKLLNGEVIIKE